jgi:hypothetical protein
LLTWALQVMGDETRRERQKRDGHEQEQVEEEKHPIDPGDRLDARVVIHPDDPDGDEARHIGEVGGPEVKERGTQVFVWDESMLISRMSSVAAMAKTPSVKASTRVVPLGSMVCA